MKEWVIGILAILNLRIKLKIILDVIDSSDQKRKFTIIMTRNSSCGKVLMFLQVCVIHSIQGGRGVSYHAFGQSQHHITSCIADQSQLVQGYHAGNIKCIMG